jgi:hypothetical protein
VKAVVEQGRWSQMTIRTLLSEGEDEIKCILYFKTLFFTIMLYASAVLKSKEWYNALRQNIQIPLRRTYKNGHYSIVWTNTNTMEI